MSINDKQRPNTHGVSLVVSIENFTLIVGQLLCYPTKTVPGRRHGGFWDRCRDARNTERIEERNGTELNSFEPAAALAAAEMQNKVLKWPG